MKLIPPPSNTSFVACMAWYRNLSAEHRQIFCDAGLTPVTWWTAQVHYRAKTISCWESNLFRGELEATAKCPSVAHFAFEFEWATVFGDMGVWGWALSKNYGKLVRVRPLTDDDSMSEWHCLVRHNESSPWRMKCEQRDWLKEKLGAKYRKIVNYARKSGWQELHNALNGGVHVFERRFFQCDTDQLFLDLIRQIIAGTVEVIRWRYPAKHGGKAIVVRLRNIVQPQAEFAGFAKRIQTRIGVDLNTFWKACRGQIMLPPPKPSRAQREFTFE